METKKTIYIAGPITGVKNYWEAFEKAEEMVEGLGYTALTPSRLPKGMTNAQYMRICLGMIDSSDAVLFLPRWEHSPGAQLEHDYCRYTDKPGVYLRTHASPFGSPCPDSVIRAWLEHDLEEVLKQ